MAILPTKVFEYLSFFHTKFLTVVLGVTYVLFGISVCMEITSEASALSNLHLQEAEL